MTDGVQFVTFAPQAGIVRLCGGDLVERLTRGQTSAAHVQTQARSTATSRRRNLNVKADADASTANVHAAGEIERGDANRLSRPPPR
jgi:hypothetical protein